MVSVALPHKENTERPTEEAAKPSGAKTEDTKATEDLKITMAPFRTMESMATSHPHPEATKLGPPPRWRARHRYNPAYHRNGISDPLLAPQDPSLEAEQVMRELRSIKELLLRPPPLERMEPVD